jgi:hypothetical protein
MYTDVSEKLAFSTIKIYPVDGHRWFYVMISALF